ncbi:type II asparaginase [Paenarthrobacter sp. NPDC056912]|uniref:type II asparaginase n=1 Tax=Paenarthrobacter sp. NPDC056912 TaxID=3345965 RepID=UPI00366F74E0
MKITSVKIASALAFCLLIPCASACSSVQPSGQSAAKDIPAEKTTSDLPNVKILATGGTIAGTSDSNTDTTDYTSGQLGVDALIAAVPEIKTKADVTGEQIVNFNSPDINSEVLLTLGKRINDLLASQEVDGVVVTHGTDTLEETAYFLNLVVKSEKPVVVVGAMRPSTALSADGPMNLYNAVRLAADPGAKAKGVMVVMNDRIGAARYTTKTNTSATDSFASTEQGYLGEFAGEDIRFNATILKDHTTKTPFDISKLDALPQVDILYSYQNEGRSLFEAAVDAGAKGIVVAGTGNGSMSQIAEEAARKTAADGTLIVRSTRVGSGIVTHKPSDDTDNFVSADSLNPQKARILLSLSLTATTNREQIQENFNIY